ncbi:NF-kappa-B-repressing factor-like [Saccoglossus kowalevskii]|uniref:NF-kappa-B-repressing factor-like n=1 Tax=Saccoglossus kowalevskii TaxID=10224 RepID=A0ABM0GQK3_SACKO|nr:PREDICTED: NF-kappa-B-repressing factor-like [Saccoglossus kowalevskii]
MEKVKFLAAGIIVGQPIASKLSEKHCSRKRTESSFDSDPPAKSARIEEDCHPINESQSPTVEVNTSLSSQSNTHQKKKKQPFPSQSPPGDNATKLGKMFQEISTRVRSLWDKDTANSIGLLNNILMVFPVKLSYSFVDRSQVLPTPKGGKKCITQWECSLCIGDVYITQAKCGSKNEAKKQCCDTAAKLLKDGHFNVSKVPRTIEEQKTVRLELVAVAGDSTSTGAKPTHPLAKLVIMEHPKELNPICTIMNSCQFSKLAVSFDFKDLTADVDLKGNIKPKHVCKTVINDQVVGVAIHESKKDAKSLSAEKALSRLRKICPVIKVNKEIEGALSKHSLIGTKTSLNEELPDSNIGSKMMKKMGWSGGGLGKIGNIGREKPVEINERFGREGLGVGRPAGKDEIDMKTAQEIIKNYTLSHDRDDLVFSPELNNEERKLLHQAANKFGLKSVSYGSGTNRHLVVKKMRSADDVMQHLVQSGGTSSRYELVLQVKGRMQLLQSTNIQQYIYHHSLAGLQDHVNSQCFEILLHV